MVVLSLSLEVAPGHTEDVYSREPKIRDAFLQVLFDHANSGGFRGSFTDGSNLVVLRRALQEKAVAVLGDIVTDVLITEIARQDS
jgi:flagellar FliL protein